MAINKDIHDIKKGEEKLDNWNKHEDTDYENAFKTVK